MIPFAPIYQHLPFYGKTLSPLFLWKLWILKPPHFIKGWGGGAEVQLCKEYVNLQHASLTERLTTLEQKRSFWPQFRPQNFFWKFQLYWKLNIVPSCNLVQFHGKLMMQPKMAKMAENGKNLNFGPNLGSLTAIRRSSKLLTCAIFRKAKKPKFKNWQKT